MADDKSSGGWGGGFMVLAFAAVSAFYVAQQKAPLVSTRPSNMESQADDLRGLPQDIDARLWQDPFGVVERDAGDTLKRDQLSSAVRHAPPGFPDSDSAKDAKETLVLGVTVPGAPYPEVAETRRRLRYAVLSALHVAEYAPTDEKHIGDWQPRDPAPQAPKAQEQAGVGTEWASTTRVEAPGRRFDARPQLAPGGAADPAQKGPNGAAQEAAPLPAFVPWEEFDHRPDNHHVLVLWLDEDFLAAARKPIRSLVEIRRQLGPFAGSDFALLGPEDSTMLEAMVNEVDPPDQSAQPFNLYNFGATAEEQRLLNPSDGGIADRLKKVGIRYYRTVNTDGELAKSLACELMLRNPKLHLPTDRCGTSSASPAGSEERDHVVLISDWDTIYGDSLLKSVVEAFTDKEAGTTPGSNWVIQRSYLRGLDGQRPDRKYSQLSKAAERNTEQKPDDEASESAEPAVATPETTSRFEGAEGQSQFDYLQRLAEELKESDAQIRRTDGGHIAAIGVLGSDVYDKLLILQALRPEFPEALFFTTDLDALLLPQNKTRYTSGLIVASSFGLKLNPELQADIPPFRSTYQTSIFLATRLAIENCLRGGTLRNTDPDEAQINKLAALPSWALPPVLFQMGRTAPRPLPSNPSTPPYAAEKDGGMSASSADGGVVALVSAVQPDPDKLFPTLPGGAYRSASLACAALLLAALFSFRSVRSLCFPSITRDQSSVPATTDKAAAWAVQPRYGLIAAISLVAFGAAFYFWWTWPYIAEWLTENGNGEPMALFEGISLWPTILLRLIGIGLSLWLICYTRRSLYNNKAQTDKELGLTRSSRSLRQEWEEIHSNLKSYPTRTAQIAALLWFHRVPPGSTKRPKFKFEELVGRFAVGWSARCIRAGIGTVAMFALGKILVPIFGQPYVPARGPLVREIYLLVTTIEVVLTLFLIFVVADAALFSRGLIKRLTAIKTQWPLGTVKKFTSQFNLPGPDLADWIDMHFLSMRTRCITRLIYLPFIALAVLLISRSALLDDFTTTWTLVIVQALSAALVIGSFVSLRSAAEQARAVARDHMTAAIIAAQASTASDHQAAQLEKLLAEIDGLNDGAFAPWSSQPLVKAVLLPLLTYGGTMLLHFYALPGN